MRTREDALPSPVPVERTNLTALILERLGDYVIDHHFTAGDKLPAERELAVQLGVSRPSLRRALSWLNRQGVIRRVQGDGTYLETAVLPVLDKHVGGARPLDADPAQLHVASVAVASSLMHLATASATTDQIDQLKATLDDAKDVDNQDWRQAELRFHLAVARLAGNSILTGVLESLLSQAMPAWTRQPQLDRRDDHAAIVSALAARDADTGVELLRRCFARHFAAAE
jgi:DNA-binding FadR family transcriptional regulator